MVVPETPQARMSEEDSLRALDAACASWKHGRGAWAQTPPAERIAKVEELVAALRTSARARLAPGASLTLSQGLVIGVATEGDEDLASVSDDILYVPPVEQFLQPFITTVPLQLLAYYVADMKGTDVDQPRNLAKSVTVE